MTLVRRIVFILFAFVLIPVSGQANLIADIEECSHAAQAASVAEQGGASCDMPDTSSQPDCSGEMDCHSSAIFELSASKTLPTLARSSMIQLMDGFFPLRSPGVIWHPPKA
ncbi:MULTISPECIES: hypothetical protein [unclassified Modicisalibacter]|uniref:hypothetical protein n=1 Tax=unclassified Modicisalibacter TaxID=2679913 RepID=UPI001CCDFFB4|nr:MULTISPECIES: hypothetical protein [unclassified Modicisalibacter]MBZ9557347.1 hypothetical protein [Modicisalibacter sp. R2A 31.J]MBZ9573987.1 hypothetical protein [Modicisalibacter sp. MOD 31.J]